MIHIKRTNSDDRDFQSLVTLLDMDLKIRDGEEHVFFAQFNKIVNLKNVVVCYHNDEAIGCGAFKEHDVNSAEIKRMFVKPDFRGMGFAKLILRELEKWSAECNYGSLILETGQKQPEAISLYKKAGYSVIPNYDQYIGVENSVCFRKIIKSNSNL